MKRKIFSLMLALMVCFSMAFSTFDPVKAESAYSACGHYGPPNVEEKFVGYGCNSTHHWKINHYTVTCRECNQLIEKRVIESPKEEHNPPCGVCGYGCP